MHRNWSTDQPKIDPTGRHLTETEMKRLIQYLSGSEFITDTLDAMSADIAEAKDEEAAHLLVQWCLNVALGHYDSIMESIELSEMNPQSCHQKIKQLRMNRSELT